MVVCMYVYICEYIYIYMYSGASKKSDVVIQQTAAHVSVYS